MNSKNPSGSMDRWLKSEDALSEYEFTDVISTLKNQKKELSSRDNYWRALIDLPLKKIMGDK